MKPKLVVAVVADELQEQAVAIARRHGAQGITFVGGRGIGFPEHRTFLGLTYQGLEQVLLFILDEQRAHAAEAAINHELRLTERFKGLVFSVPIDKAMGMDVEEMARYLDGLPQGPSAQS